MDAVQAGELRIAQVLGDGLVRKDHGLFDERGRVGLDAQVDTRRTPLLIENHARLDRVEVEAARPLAGGEPLLRQARQRGEAVGKPVARRASAVAPHEILRLRAFGAPLRMTTVQQRLRFLVRQARMRADERRIQIVGHEPRPIVEVEVGRHRTTHFVGLERAQIARQLVGQHGNHTVDEVHAGRPPARIEVERGIPRHVVRHVGDMHAQPPTRHPEPALVHHADAGSNPAGRNGLQADRIVEVPRIGRIDGERETLPQVAVPRRQRAVLVEHRASRLRKRPFGEHRLQLVTGDHHVYGRVLVVGEPEHLLDNAGGRRVARRKRRDAHAHERSVFDVGPVGTHGEYVIGDVRIFGHDHAEGFGHLVAPHERVVRTVDDPQHARRRLLSCAKICFAFMRLLLAAALHGQRRHFHEIAVERTRHLGFRNEELALRRLHEAEAASAHAQHAPRVATGMPARMGTRPPHG